MICPQPQCKSWTRVLETRHKYDNEVYRRYECANGHRFSTMERVKLKEVKNADNSDIPRRRGGDQGHPLGLRLADPT